MNARPTPFTASDQELADISAALRVAAHSDEDDARVLGESHALFPQLTARAARLRRLRHRVKEAILEL